MRWCLALLVGLPLLAACGGPSIPAPPNPATAKVGVTEAYETVFDLADPSLTPKVADVQDGPTIRSSLRRALSSPLAESAAGAVINGVTILSPTRCTSSSAPSPCARVTYEIDGPTSGGILENVTGYAVYVDGKWLVAKVTMCSLLGLFWQATHKRGRPPGC